MRTVYFMRHGKAVKRERTESDLKRKLTLKGRREVKKAAIKLCGRLQKGFDLIISSPAKRALKSAAIVSAQYKFRQIEVHIEDVLYKTNSSKDVINLLCSLDDSKTNVLVIGHNPVLSDTIFNFAPILEIILPTAGIIGITFDTDTWAEIGRAKSSVSFAHMNDRKYKFGITLSQKSRIYKSTFSFILAILKELEIDPELIHKYRMGRLCKKMSRELFDLIRKGLEKKTGLKKKMVL